MTGETGSLRLRNKILQEVIDEIREEESKRVSFPHWNNWMNWGNWNNWNWRNWWT